MTAGRKASPQLSITRPTSVITGQLLTLNDHHKIAIHSRAGELWVAEFHGDHAELVRAAAWFRVHYGIGHMSFPLRRALGFAVPLSNEIELAIDKLHQRRLERAPSSSSFRRISAAFRQSGPVLSFDSRSACCFQKNLPAGSRNPMNAWDASKIISSTLD